MSRTLQPQRIPHSSTPSIGNGKYHEQDASAPEASPSSTPAVKRSSHAAHSLVPGRAVADSRFANLRERHPKSLLYEVRYRRNVSPKNPSESARFVRDYPVNHFSIIRRTIDPSLF